jgi:hypothetical protein
MNAKSAHEHLLRSRHALRENGCHRQVVSSTAVTEFLTKVGNSAGDQATKHGMASYHIARKEEPENITLGRQSYGNFFWDSEGCIPVIFLEKGETIDAARYVQTLNKLRLHFVKNVRRRKLSSFNMTRRDLTLHV